MSTLAETPAVLLLATVDAEPPAPLVIGLRSLLPVPVEVVPAGEVCSRATELAPNRLVVVVPYLLSVHDAGGAELRAAVRGVKGAIVTSGLGPHPVLAAELCDAVRRAGLRADAGIVVVADAPPGAEPADDERPAVSRATPAEPDPDVLPDEEVAARRDLAQLVYDIDSVWVGPVAGALAGARPAPVDVVRRMAGDGRDVAVVEYSLRPLALDQQRLALVGAVAVVRPGFDERRVGVVVDRFEQGLAELRAGLDEDAWTPPLV